MHVNFTWITKIIRFLLIKPTSIIYFLLNLDFMNVYSKVNNKKQVIFDYKSWNCSQILELVILNR